MDLSIFQIMMHAGVMGKLIMLTLLLFSLASWSIIFMKFLTYRRAQNASLDFLDAFWESKTLNEAYAAAREFSMSPEAAVFVSGYTELKKISQAQASGQNPPTLEGQLATMDNLKRAVRKAQVMESDRLASSLGVLATTGSATTFYRSFRYSLGNHGLLSEYWGARFRVISRCCSRHFRGTDCNSRRIGRCYPCCYFL